MPEPVLTVIIPTYNSEKFIGKLLSCLENQIFKNFSVLIVDDASIDNTISIIKQYYKHDLYINLIELNENHGVSYARNVGIRNARTPYITFIDADDWIDILTFNDCSNYFIEDIDIINYGLSYDYLSYDISRKKYVYKHDCVISGEYAMKLYGHTIHDEYAITPIVNNKIYRLSFILENKIFFDEEAQYQEDDIFTFKTLLFAKKVAFKSSCYYHYFQNSTSAIHQVSQISINHFIVSYKHLLEYLIENQIFEKYKNEFYLKFKSSLLGVMRRTIQFCKEDKQKRNLIVLFIKNILENFNAEEFLLYCDVDAYNL